MKKQYKFLKFIDKIPFIGLCMWYIVITVRER